MNERQEDAVMQDISDCLSLEAQNVAEARLAAKRAARAEAREIRMKELERQQKEVEERPDKDFAEKGGRPVSSLSAATLASLGGTTSRRGSGDTSISVDTEASIREIKDSLAEVEEKYKRSMVTNAQLDNEKTSLQYQVDTLREVLQELEEELAESRRQYEDKQKECERQKHDQGVLRFQLAEMKEALEQREALITALERQKEFFDPVRSERDVLREEVTHLREALKKHGIVLDSDGALNGDTSIEHHVNSDGPPDPPVRAVSMGKTEGTVEKKETMSVVGEGPPSGTEQDRQERTQDAQKEIELHAEGGEVKSEKENSSDADVEIAPVEICGHSKSETNMDEQKEEMSCDIREEKQEVAHADVLENMPVEVCSHRKSETNMEEQKEEVSCHIREEKQEVAHADVLENMSEVDGETISKQSDVSPSGSEVFQDAIDFDDETPSTMNEFYEDVTGCVNDCEKEEPKNKLTDDQCTTGGVPEEGAETPNENTVNICKNDEGKQDSNKASGSPEEVSTEFSETIASHKNVDLEHEGPVEDEIEPQQSLLEESGSQTIEENIGQSKNEVLSAAEDSGDTDQSKIINAPEQPPQEAILTKKELVAQVGREDDKTSDGSESSTVTKRKSVTEDEPIKDHVVPEQKHAPEGETEGGVSLESKVGDQREEEISSQDLVCDNIQNADDTTANKAESPKAIVPPEVISSEGESTQEGEETDDEDDDKDNGTVRSEKYTGESEVPCTSLGSSVDGQSLEDIRMDDASDKSPRRGKGKNKEDCVVS